MQSFFNRIAAAALLVVACAVAQAQEVSYENIGSAPGEEDIKAWDIAISPDGHELPRGKGTAKEGKPLYDAKCASCHGLELEGRGSRIAPALMGGRGTLAGNHPKKSVGSYWAFSTTLWDYINRAMPRFQERTLTPDEVYAISAYILYKNDIIKENYVLNERTLPKIKMPNRDGFLPSRIEELADPIKRGCRAGLCP